MRPLIAALFFLLAANSSPPAPHQRQQHENTATAQNAASAPANTARAEQPPEYTSPCGPGEERRNSDLCAQWKAADAAAESSRLNWWQLLIGIVGAAGLVTALALTIRSNRIAGKALRLAQTTARQELRAYIGIIDYEIEAPGIGGSGSVSINIKNYGQSPAVRLETQICIGTAPWCETPKVPQKWAYEGEKSPFDVPPQAPIHRIVPFPNKVFEDMYDIEDNKAALYVRFSVDYFDVFGRRWRQTTDFYSRGRHFKIGTIIPFDQTAEECEEPAEE